MPFSISIRNGRDTEAWIGDICRQYLIIGLYWHTEHFGDHKMTLRESRRRFLASSIAATATASTAVGMSTAPAPAQDKIALDSGIASRV